MLLTAGLFAAGHLGNDDVTFFSTLNTALAGIWLGVAYLKTRTLWLCFGVHFAWNWVQGSFFGIEVSGFKDFATAPLLLEIDSGPVWITGGDYGIEGGLACTIALVLIDARDLVCAVSESKRRNGRTYIARRNTTQGARNSPEEC